MKQTKRLATAVMVLLVPSSALSAGETAILDGERLKPEGRGATRLGWTYFVISGSAGIEAACSPARTAP